MSSARGQDLKENVDDLLFIASEPFRRSLTGAGSSFQNTGVEETSKHVLLASYDRSLLMTRKLLLEQIGYSVTSAFGFTEARSRCRASSFDLFILDHCIPEADKLALIAELRQSCSAPILSLERLPSDYVPCDFHASPDNPEKFLQIVADIVAGKASRSAVKEIMLS